MFCVDSKNFVQAVITHIPIWTGISSKQFTLFIMKRLIVYGSRYSIIDQVNIVEDSL